MSPADRHRYPQRHRDLGPSRPGHRQSASRRPVRSLRLFPIPLPATSLSAFAPGNSSRDIKADGGIMAAEHSGLMDRAAQAWAFGYPLVLMDFTHEALTAGKLRSTASITTGTTPTTPSPTNLQVIAGPDGAIVWVSGPVRGATHDLKAARIWGVIRELAATGLIVLADNAFQGAGDHITTTESACRSS
jgi:hypothetical protein